MMALAALVVPRRLPVVSERAAVLPAEGLPAEGRRLGGIPRSAAGPAKAAWVAWAGSVVRTRPPKGRGRGRWALPTAKLPRARLRQPIGRSRARGSGDGST